MENPLVVELHGPPGLRDVQSGLQVLHDRVTGHIDKYCWREIVTDAALMKIRLLNHSGPAIHADTRLVRHGIAVESGERARVITHEDIRARVLILEDEVRHDLLVGVPGHAALDGHDSSASSCRRLLDGLKRRYHRPQDGIGVPNGKSSARGRAAHVRCRNDRNHRHTAQQQLYRHHRLTRVKRSLLEPAPCPFHPR